MRTKLKLTLALVFAFVLASTAYAQQAHTVYGGTTKIQFSSAVLAAMSSMGVTMGAISPTRMHRGTVSFPIADGAFDAKSGMGELDHAGGLTFTDGQTHVVVQSFIIDTTGAHPVLTGLMVVDGTLMGRMPFFDLAIASTKVSKNGEVLWIGGVQLTLDAAAAAQINTSFGISAFSAGYEVGTAKVTAEFDPMDD